MALPSHNGRTGGIAARARRTRSVRTALTAIVCCVLCTGCIGIALRAIRAVSAAARPADARSTTQASCDNLIAPITEGYGSDGPYAVENHTLPGSAGVDGPTVFLPAKAPFPRPVIFLLHGYGPNDWRAYQDLIGHLVSRGLIVVYGTYPTRGGFTMDERYEALWTSFLASASAFREQMDLTRVGFVGHSFGGGATPALARRGLAGQGWGRQGAFELILAPWFAFEVSEADLATPPPRLLQAIEIYDHDAINDHRIAIDLHQHSRPAGGQYFFLVRSVLFSGCEITADHRTPALGSSLRLKQYAVFRPLDALVDAAFDDSASARAALAQMGDSSPPGAYQPLVTLTAPAPQTPESRYVFKWSAWINPRRTQEAW